jgi:hypothetical protein
MQLEKFGTTISYNWLLAIYAIVPALIFVWWIDVTFFQKSLLPYMGVETLLLPAYLLVFELPHIIASLLTFADKDYLNFYHKHLIIGLPLIVIITGILFYQNPILTFFIYICATIYHALRQQTGIASMLAKIKSKIFYIWNTTLILAAIVTWTLVSAPKYFSSLELRWYSDSVFFLILLSIVLGLIYAYKAKTIIGRRYIIATTLMMVSAYFFILVGYIFFAFFVIRFVHDLTAFTFYIVHDTNRNSLTIKNNFYVLFRRLKLPLVIVVPLVSISLALALRLGVSKVSFAMAVLILLGFIHYYVESIMWKRDSLHRQQIKFN